MLIGPAYTQVAIKSEKALQNLRWIGSERITAAAENQKEQEEYQRAFAAAMEGIA